jgi:hypothetical protein
MPDLSRLGAASLGLWTRAQALELLSAGEVDSLVRCGTWQVVWRGVYADAGFLLDAEQLAMVAVLAAGGADQPSPFGEPDPVTGRQRRRLRAIACGRTAARVWKFPLIDDNDPATGAQEHLLDDVSLWRHLPSQQHEGRTLLAHQLVWARGDLTRTSNGLWLTAPGRTLVDCARLLTHEALVCAMDDALHRKLVPPEQLTEVAEGRMGNEGAPVLRLAVRLADGRAEAPSETLARLILLPVLPGLRPQVTVFDEAARPLARFDLADEGIRFAVELDGRAGHAGEQMVAKDRRRDRRTEGLGWWTERATWFELRRRQGEFMQRVVQKHREHGEQRRSA